MVSFVLTTRDDGYGGTVEGIDNFTMRRLDITIDSLLMLPIKGEIIIVDWCPDKGKEISEYFTREKTLKECGFLKDKEIVILKVNPYLQNLLDKDNPAEKKLPFYEYVAKHIGIEWADNERIIACNPDNIFPVDGIHEVITEISDDVLVRAKRLDISREYAKRPIGELVGACRADGFKVQNVWDTAGGDFCGFTKNTYDLIGGYTLKHINWHTDGDFEHKAWLAGLGIVRPYHHFHIDHDGATVEAEGRPTQFNEVKAISPKIIRELPEYVSEVRF